MVLSSGKHNVSELLRSGEGGGDGRGSVVRALARRSRGCRFRYPRALYGALDKGSAERTAYYVNASLNFHDGNVYCVKTEGEAFDYFSRGNVW